MLRSSNLVSGASNSSPIRNVPSVGAKVQRIVTYASQPAIDDDVQDAFQIVGHKGDGSPSIDQDCPSVHPITTIDTGDADCGTHGQIDGRQVDRIGPCLRLNQRQVEQIRAEARIANWESRTRCVAPAAGTAAAASRRSPSSMKACRSASTASSFSAYSPSCSRILVCSVATSSTETIKPRDVQYIRINVDGQSRLARDRLEVLSVEHLGILGELVA